MIGHVAGQSKTNGQPRCCMLDESVLCTYRSLLRRIGWSQLNSAVNQPDRIDAKPELCCLGITSSSRRQGVTTVAWQLAAAAAELSGGVLLVDANLQNANVHRIFRVRQSPGLAESLVSPKSLEENIFPVEGYNLSLLSIGNVTSECRKLLTSSAIDEVVEFLRPHHDLIVFDMPPSNEGSTGLRLAETLDGVVLVLESGRANMDAARHSRRLLESTGVPVLGAVLNKEHRQKWPR